MVCNPPMLKPVRARLSLLALTLKFASIYGMTSLTRLFSNNILAMLFPDGSTFGNLGVTVMAEAWEGFPLVITTIMGSALPLLMRLSIIVGAAPSVGHASSSPPPP